MSGTLFSLSGGPLTALSGIGSLVLGGMVFTDFALPERMTHGGQQQLTVHKLPGGGRVIDDMGDDPKEVTWSGLWLGPDAAIQRMELEALRTAGDPLDLTWSDQYLNVVIADCQYDEEHTARRIRYRITCTVLPDPQDEDEDGSGADESQMGNGEQPDTPAKARDSGQSKLTSGRASAGKIPEPPIPPDNPPLTSSPAPSPTLA